VITGTDVIEDSSAPHWLSRRSVTPPDPPNVPMTVVIPDLHRAFPAAQTPGTRLILTQATYQLQRWLDWLESHPGVEVIGVMQSASRGAAGEALSRRGPWSRIDILEREARVDPYAPGGARASENSPLLASFLQPDPSQRLRAGLAAVREDPTNPAVHLAAGSACMELQDFAAAHRSLERALTLAPDWEAPHFEAGKLWLRGEEMGHAAAAFAEAARLMPSFAAASGNLGAVLGELERPDEALAALERALRSDPYGYPVLNNIGAVHRDSGHLRQAEAAFRRVVDINPGFVFGYYNLGQTLLMQGRVADARDAYEAGVTRDERKTPRQVMRLAAIHAATGDVSRATSDIEEVLARAHETERTELLAEAERTLTAISAAAGTSDTGVSRVLQFVRRYSS